MTKHSERVPKAMQDKYAAIVEITDAFCQEHLDEDYARLIRAALAALSRRRPSPLTSGAAKSWACGVTHAIGMVNFLFDLDQKPHIAASALYKVFDVSQTVGLSKSKLTRDLLAMHPFHPDWCVPQMLADNPMVWMFNVDGMIIDVREMPRDFQEVLVDEGLIPYLPAETEQPAAAEEDSQTLRQQELALFDVDEVNEILHACFGKAT